MIDLLIDIYASDRNNVKKYGPDEEGETSDTRKTY